MNQNIITGVEVVDWPDLGFPLDPVVVLLAVISYLHDSASLVDDSILPKQHCNQVGQFGG